MLYDLLVNIGSDSTNPVHDAAGSRVIGSHLFLCHIA